MYITGKISSLKVATFETTKVSCEDSSITAMTTRIYILTALLNETTSYISYCMNLLVTYTGVQL